MCKISFVIIGYNIEKYIGRSIKSAINQNLEEIEIIVIDDGSTDNTFKEAEKLKDKDGRISIFTQDNLGANAARKLGVSKATGKYVIFMDGDDWIKENSIKDLYDLAEVGKYDIIQFGYYLAYDDKNEVVQETNIGDITSIEYLELLLKQKISHNIWNRIYNREFLNRSNFDEIADITMGDDLVANVHLSINDPKIKIIDKAYYYYYQRANSVTKKSSVKILEIEKALMAIENILKDNNILDKYKDEMDYLWFIHCYLYPVIISNRDIDTIHKRMYSIWRKHNIEIENNKYYIEILKKLDSKTRLKKKLYDSNYFLGSSIHKIVKSINKVK